MKSDIDIAHETNMKPVIEIGSILGIRQDDLELFGKYKAKLPIRLIEEDKVRKNKLVLVTAITPTPAGEGKTTTSIGLAQALNKLGKKATVVLREPSLGPVFGIKGGATGGGYSQVLPMEDINLHFTGDISAVEKAHNLLAALIDNNIQNLKYSLGIDPRTIKWKRVIDMNERSLRNIIIGLGGQKQGIPRETGFDITAASEVMAILCLSRNIADLKERFGKIFIGYTYDDKPVFARDLKAHGAMAALMKDAIKPNLVQTTEGTPAIIHGGPFGNIAQGTNSIIATKMGLTFSDYVITEAGFASELGAEKFFDIKCQAADLSPQAVVLVTTIRALKYHGNVKLKELDIPNTEAVIKGLENFEKHIENIQCFNFNPVVAINKFISDTDEEIKIVKNKCNELGIKVSICEAWEKGSNGTIDLANKVVETVNNYNGHFKPLYSIEQPIEEKIETIALKLYGAKDIEYSIEAKVDIQNIKELGLDKMPICMAKTQKSLSDDQYKRGRPKDYILKIRKVEFAAGAGFIIPISGTIMRMPGLSAIPAAEAIDIDIEGNIIGLY
ncbi:MAG: formate--tetrahydrofolate ligase [Bacteroidota bacterium]|nr:formate--tetrahydrofolate ligase [Bacteroidota bacterium]